MKKCLGILCLICLSVLVTVFADGNSQHVADGEPDSPPQRITYSAEASYNPQLEISGLCREYVHLIWNENNRFFYRRNTNGGWHADWDDAVALTTHGTLESWISNPMHIAASGNNVYVVMVWRPNPGVDHEIWFRKSSNYGATWAPWKMLTDNSGESQRPRLAAVGNCVHVVWQDENPGNYEVYYKRSTDFGESFGPPVRLSYSAGESQYPDVCQGGSNVYLIWQDDNIGNNEIYFKKSLNQGASFGSAHRLTYNAGSSTFPRIDCDLTGQYVHVAWQDNNPGNTEIFYKRNIDYGANTGWSGPRRISYTAGESCFPSLDCNGAAILELAWADSNPGNWEIISKTSLSSGASWSGAMRWTYNSGRSRYPVINAESWDIVWQDDNPGNLEIFYKR